MASRPITAEQMLAAIPSLPRPTLARLVDHMIDRLDELDGDPDDEDNGDAEPIDEREPDEEFGFVINPPAGPMPSALPRHFADGVGSRWRLSIVTDTSALVMIGVPFAPTKPERQSSPA
ncbi:hypothetical protein D9601_10300 [Sphingomonas sp. MA1305]|uniref:hypothetical protein n=1 Tax=Sphingomonas sp. MA1305 TaxID=2479204 RepID=UPI0018DF62FD|nr:hypothetical protein [Sphingomonas sp. MA1305]MBI0475742.1 hypothetical protein [Sphingomonas sp. MA1305]